MPFYLLLILFAQVDKFKGTYTKQEFTPFDPCRPGSPLDPGMPVKFWLDYLDNLTNDKCLKTFNKYRY